MHWIGSSRPPVTRDLGALKQENVRLTQATVLCDSKQQLFFASIPYCIVIGYAGQSGETPKAP